MSDNLALASVFHSVPGIEDTRYTGHESFVEVVFEKAVAMRIHSLDASFVCNGDMVVANSDEWSILSVSSVDGGKLLPLASVVSYPRIAEFCKEGTRNIAQ